MNGINGEMTVKEALQFCSPDQQINLAHWAESFGLKLREFHIGHIKTYESERQDEADLHTINCEVGTLLILLHSISVGAEVRKSYQALREPDELSSEEKAALPDKVRKYIETLEGELRDLMVNNNRITNRLRKANWARWRA